MMQKAYNVFILILLCMVGWTNTLDTATPSGGDAPSVLDDRDRETKKAFQERLNFSVSGTTEEGMHFPLTAGAVTNADAGKFRSLVFTDEDAAQSADGGAADTHTPDVNEGILDIKNSADDTVRELFFWDEQGNVVPITDDGQLYLAGTYDRDVTFSGVGSSYTGAALLLEDDGRLKLPADTTNATEQNLRYNTTDDAVEFRNASAWVALAPVTNNARIKVGSYSGTAGAQNISLGTGNAALAVIIKRNTGTQNTKAGAYTGGAMINWNLSGTANPDSDDPITQHADGFTVAAGDSAVNADGETHYYVAFY